MLTIMWEQDTVLFQDNILTLQDNISVTKCTTERDRERERENFPLLSIFYVAENPTDMIVFI